MSDLLDDALAGLESIETKVISKTKAKKASVITKAVKKDDSISVSELEELERELAVDEATTEVYSRSPVDKKELAPTKSVTTPDSPKIRTRAPGDSRPSVAVLARLGGIAAAEAYLIYNTTDADLSADVLRKLVKQRLDNLDKLAKKVGEKSVNLLAHLAGSAKLSNYTVMALKLLFENKHLTSKELQECYLKRPYSQGTARSQCGQMMQLLPAMEIAEKLGPGSLKLNDKSVLACALADSVLV